MNNETLAWITLWAVSAVGAIVATHERNKVFMIVFLLLLATSLGCAVVNLSEPIRPARPPRIERKR